MRLTRRAAFLAAASLPLAGCSVYDSWFGDDKPKLPGTRLAVMVEPPSIAPDAGTGPVTLPPQTAVVDWALPGGTPTHSGGHLAARAELSRAWSASIGSGAGERRRLTGEPVIAGGRVFTMDSDARVSAFDAASGNRLWDATTRGKDDRSTNVGGGVAAAGGSVYAVTGRAEIVAFDAGTGAEQWRQSLPTPARSSPTIADGHIYVTLIDDSVIALDLADGKKIWSHQAQQATTSVLGLPAPLAANGMVVAGFSTGELRALRSATGTNAWGDNLSGIHGRLSISDFATIRAMPASSGGRLYAGGLGRLFVALDIRTGRRLWERAISVGEMAWLAGDWLFVVTLDGVVAAMSASEGRVAWTQQLERWGDPEKLRDAILWTGPVLAGGRLYLAGSNGKLAILDPISGKILAQPDLSGPASLSPVSAGGALFIVTDDGTLTCYR